MKLIIINGPCGIGKSTAAKNVQDLLPLSFLVDIDAQRRSIGRYRECREESRVLSYAVTFGIVEACLKEGRDVIVEKMINDESVLDALRAIGEKYGAEVYEFILWMPKDLVLKRAFDRGYSAGNSLTPQKTEAFWDAIDTLKNNRPQAKVIDVSRLDEEQVLKEIIHNMTLCTHIN